MEADRSMGRTRIMLVEDDALLRDSLSIYFRTKGCSLQAFPDAEAAVEALGKEVPDVVISDHLLPGMDGLAFLRYVGSRNPEAFRILITALPESVLPAETVRAEADEYIQKPLTAAVLEKTLLELLRRRGSGEPKDIKRGNGYAFSGKEGNS